jgi:hypothetical protein
METHRIILVLPSNQTEKAKLAQYRSVLALDTPLPRALILSMPKKKIPTLLPSTRSHESADAHRDFDHFDPDEELRRMRWAFKKSIDAKMTTGERRDALRLVVEMAMNLDESLTRQGTLPRAWAYAKRPAMPGTDRPCHVKTCRVVLATGSPKRRRKSSRRLGGTSVKNKS